jgi:hypothetical protein
MVPAFLGNATGEIYTWTDDDGPGDWNNCRNWNDQTAPCGSNYPQNAGDAAFIDLATDSGSDVNLVDATIRKLAISRDVDLGPAATDPELHVRTFTIYAAADNPNFAIDVTIADAKIIQPPGS